MSGLRLQHEDPLKSEMTFEEFMIYVSESDQTDEKKLKLYNKVSDHFVQALFLMCFNTKEKHQLIHFASRPNNFILGKNRLAKQFHPLQPKTIVFEPIPQSEISLFNKRGDPYSKFVFDTWDGDYIAKCIDNDRWTLSTDAHCSMEMYLMTYMTMYSKKQKYYVQDFIEDKAFMGHLKKINHILYYALPAFVKILLKNSHYQNRYKQFERKLLAFVRILVDESNNDQYRLLKKMKKMRKFLDVLKTRSHLPTAFGMYIMNVMNAMQYSKSQIKKYIEQPTKAPGDLQTMMGYYWMQMLLPFDESK
jgi:hypothetical protein